MNTQVSFELAKLLKVKGFDENCSDYYTQTGDLNSDGWGDIIYEQGFGSGEPDRMLRFNYSDFNKNQKETCFLCPTIAEIVMWLYEKHGIWINPIPRLSSWIFTIQEVRTFNNESLIDIDFYESNTYLKSKGVPTIMKSPTEAYEAAIEYTLKNLL